MKNSYKLGLATIAASLALVGCGGGGSADGVPEVQGNLYNTYVAGAKYVCKPSGRTGITDNKGTYTCNLGDTVEFFLGNYSIGTATAAEGILDTDNLSSNDAADTDLLQLLQGIDDESDGVITIPENFDALDDFNVSLGDQNFETLFDDFVTTTDANITLENETTAVNNHAENLLQAYLASQTYYVIDDVNKVITHYSYNADLTSVTFEYELLGENIDVPQPGTNTIFTRDGKLVYSNGDYDTFAEKTEHYILINEFAADGSKYGVAKLYTQAYYDAYKAEVAASTNTTTTDTTTKDFLAGKTFYLSDREGMESFTFSADMTTVTKTDLITGNTFSPSPISINGDTITYTNQSYISYIVDMNSLTTDTITIHSTDNTMSETWYLNQEARLRGLLANNTWESQNAPGNSMTFNTDVTSMTRVTFGGGIFNEPVTLNGMLLTKSGVTDLIIIKDDTTLIFNPGTVYMETFTLQPATTTAAAPAPTIEASMFFGKHIEFTGFAGKFDFTSTTEAVGYLGTYYKEDGTAAPMMWNINQANELRIALYNTNMIWQDIAIFEFPEGLNSGAVVDFQDLVNNSNTQITISVFN